MTVEYDEMSDDQAETVKAATFSLLEVMEQASLLTGLSEEEMTIAALRALILRIFLTGVEMEKALEVMRLEYEEEVEHFRKLLGLGPEATPQDVAVAWKAGLPKGEN